MLGSIASIETMSTVDGPGIRCVVFLNGCRKRCLYCHNPEMFEIGKKETPVKELVLKLLRYKNYFTKNGGITFSGGESLLQTDFLIEVCKELKKENIHISIDTAGDFLGNIQELFNYIDLVILDIKDTRIKEYQDLTKVKIDKIEEFIKILNKTQVNVSLRQVIIPSIHDNLEYLKKLKKYISKINNVQDIIFLPYHKLGKEKYKKLNINYPMQDIPEMDKNKCEKLYQDFLKLN